jgi:two-component system, OmpR family, response regulator
VHGKKKILVVDDDELILAVTKDLLADERYEIMTHLEGFGVLHLVNLFHPDLVLLDINMPALSGEHLAVMLCSTTYVDTGHSRIVFYSSNDEDSLRESVSVYGAHGYICKGDIANLRNKVDQYLSLPVP